MIFSLETYKKISYCKGEGILPKPHKRRKPMGNIIPKTSVITRCLSALNVENYRSPFHDHGAKKLLSGQTIALLIEAQLKKRESLDDIAENLKSNKQLQCFLDLESVHSSTIYRKMGKIPNDYLKNLYLDITSRVLKHHRNTSVLPDIGLLHIIDSTEVRLPERCKWAYCSTTMNGIKIHTRYALFNRDTSIADQIVTSTAAVSDQEAAEYLVTDPNATYVFDRGYINYSLYHKWVQTNIPFVARVKANSKLMKLAKREVTENSNIILDADVLVTIPKTELTFQLRLVEYKDDQGRKYRVVTNRWDISPETVAEIYRLRWKIELFFKWIKQHLNVKKWFSHKPEAIWNQIYIILIASALCEWIKILVNCSKTTWQLLKIMRHYWFRSWDEFMDILSRPPSRQSKGRKKKGKPGRPRKHPKVYKAVKIINI